MFFRFKLLLKLFLFFCRSLAWDGYHVFIGGKNGILYLWDLERFELIHEIKAHSGKMCFNKAIIVNTPKKYMQI